MNVQSRRKIKFIRKHTRHSRAPHFPHFSLSLSFFIYLFIFLSLSRHVTHTDTPYTCHLLRRGNRSLYTDQLDVSTEAAVFRARTWRWRSSNFCRLSTWLLAARGPRLEYERRGSITLRAENWTDCGKRGRQVVTLTADNAVRTLRPRGAKCVDWSL